MFGFAKKIEERYPLAFPLLGSLLLFMSLSLTILVSHPNYDLWWIVLLGIAFSWKFHWRGFFSAIIALIFSMLFKHMELPSYHIWQLGLEFSIALGLWITTDSGGRLKEYVMGFQEEIVRGARKSKALQDELQRKNEQFASEKNVMQERLDQIKKELADGEIDKTSLKELIRNLKERDDEKEYIKEEYFREIAAKTGKVQSLELQLVAMQDEIKQLGEGEKLQEKNRCLLNQLNVVRVDKYQSRLINEALAKTLTREMKRKEVEYIYKIQTLEAERDEWRRKVDSLHGKLVSIDSSHENEVRPSEEFVRKIESLEKERNELKEEIVVLQRKMEDFSSEPVCKEPHFSSDQHRRTEASLWQLKKQFNEKKQVLHQTRTELFRLQGEVFVRKREEESYKYEPDLQEEQLIGELYALEEERENLEKENLLLQDIIQILNEKLQPLPNLFPPKEEKKSPFKERQLPLYGKDPYLIPDAGLGFHKKSR